MFITYIHKCMPPYIAIHVIKQMQLLLIARWLQATWLLVHGIGMCICTCIGMVVYTHIHKVSMVLSHTYTRP